MAKDVLRLGCGAGFSSDRLEPAIDLARDGRLDYLVFETIGERTLAFGHRDRKARPEARLQSAARGPNARRARPLPRQRHAHRHQHGRRQRRGGRRGDRRHRPRTGSRWPQGRMRRGRRRHPPDDARHGAVRSRQPHHCRGRQAGGRRQRLSRHRRDPAGARDRCRRGDHRPRRRSVAVPVAARAPFRLGARRLGSCSGAARWSAT